MLEPTKQQIDAAMATYCKLNSQLSAPLLVPHILRAALNASAPIDGTGWAEAAFSDDVDPAQRDRDTMMTLQELRELQGRAHA